MSPERLMKCARGIVTLEIEEKHESMNDVNISQNSP
jgi:hypothetical protein